jgi:hypothetical protein
LNNKRRKIKMVRRTAAQKARSRTRERRKKLVKKKPTGKFSSMLVAHIPGCTALKAYQMQVDGIYQYEVKVRSAKSGRAALPKPWANFYRVDLGRMATRCAIYEARGSAQTCAIPQQTVELGLSNLIAPSGGQKPQYTVFRLGALVFEGPPKSPECINLLYDS